MKRIISILLLITLILGSGIALASDVTDAKYLTTIRITNDGTALTDEIAVFTLSTSAMISDDMLSANASDCAMLTGESGSDLAFMPSANSSYPWVTWVNSIGADTDVLEELYSKDATGGKIRYFPDDAGMTTADSATLELGDNSTVEIKGRVNTDNGTDKNLLNKDDAFRLFVSPTVSENITALVYGGGGNVTLTQLLSDGTVALCSDCGDGTRAGFRINNVLDGTLIHQVDFYLLENNAPTGTGYARVRAVSDDSILGTLGTIDVSTIGGAGWEVFNTTPVGIEGTQDIYVLFEYSTSATPNNVHFYKHSVNQEADTIFTKYDGSYHDDATDDARYKFYYSSPTSVTATGVASGEHDIKVEADGTFFGIGVDIDSGVDFSDSDGLVLNLPLHHTDMTGAAITSKDDYGHIATVTGATWGSTGRTFDGTNDNIVVPDDPSLDITGNITVEAWLRVAGDQVADVAEKYDGVNIGFLWLAPNGNAMTFYVGGTAIVNAAKYIFSVAYHDIWWHFVGVYDGVDTMLYVNGVYEVNAVTPLAPVSAAEDVYIGERYTGANDFTGNIGEFRIYDQALTPAKILQNYNATKWRYDGTVTGNSDTYFIYNALGASVPDNANDYVSVQNGSMDYMESQEITIDGVQQQLIRWEYDTTFTDLSGNGHDSIPSYRTSASDADLTASIISQVGLLTRSTPTGAVIGGWTMIEDIPATPDDLFTEGADGYGIGGFNFGELITDTAEEAGQDPDAWHIIIAFALALAAMLGSYKLTHNTKMGQRGSLFISALIAEGVLILFYKWETIPGFVLIPFGILAVGLIVFRKSHSPVD